MEIFTKNSLEVTTTLKALNHVLAWFEGSRAPFVEDKDWLQCQLALAEGFTNAVRHAHKGLPPETPIEIEVRVYTHQLEIRLWDFGPVFDLEAHLQKRAPDRHAGGGRGLEILNKIADRLSYSREEERNCLLIVKEYSLL